MEKINLTFDKEEILILQSVLTENFDEGYMEDEEIKRFRKSKAQKLINKINSAEVILK